MSTFTACQAHDLQWILLVSHRRTANIISAGCAEVLPWNFLLKPWVEVVMENAVKFLVIFCCSSFLRKRSSKAPRIFHDEFHTTFHEMFCSCKCPIWWHFSLCRRLSLTNRGRSHIRQWAKAGFIDRVCGWYQHRPFLGSGATCDSKICLSCRVAQEPNRNREPKPSEPYFPKTESGTGTAGTVLQEPKPEPEPSFPVKLYWNTEKPLLQTNHRNRKPEPLEPLNPQTATEPNRTGGPPCSCVRGIVSPTCSVTRFRITHVQNPCKRLISGKG